MSAITTKDRDKFLDALEHPQKGGVARAVYEAVEHFHREGMSQNQAINEVAMRTGREPGTVSANYYRYKRELLPKVGDQPVRVDANLEALVRGINDGLTQLLEAYAAKTQEVERLRDEHSRFERVREALLS